MNIKTLFQFFLLLLIIKSNTIAQWNSNPALNTSVATPANDQQDLRIISDSKGGAIITWCDYRNNITNADIYTQRINSQGITIWTNNGIGVCTQSSHQTAPAIVEDGSGGSIIIWQDWRNGNRDIFAQRVDSSGNVKWTANGLGIVVKTYEQQDPKHISDGAGGAIITWQDSINGNWDIFSQRINSDGIIQWTSGGLAICTAVYDQINPRIETDVQGGAIITWQDKRNGVDYNIYAQRINASGIIQWTGNGVAVCGYSNTQNNPKIDPDAQGGAIIAWQDKRSGTYDIYAQLINSSGICQWTANGIPICTASGSQSAIDIATENINGAIITWKDMRGGTYFDIYAQLVSLTGVIQWTTNGVAICTAWEDQINPNIIGDGLGGAIIVWEDEREGNTNASIYSQLINSAGTVQWTNNGVATGIAASNQTNPKHVADGSGGAIFAWQDKRTLNFDIYAHHLTHDGIANINNESHLSDLVDINVFPNPFTSSTTISVINEKNINLYGNNIELVIYNITGKKFLKLYSLSGNQSNIKINNNCIKINIERGNLSSGVYFFQLNLKQNDKAENLGNGKLVIIEP
ncbi:MAG: hypothetical protein HY738_09725 [Bacteroidia bacterium]|nr:hypothetical protein [Bacteroidia bacterium]